MTFQEMDADHDHIKKLAMRLWQGLKRQLQYIELNGDPIQRWVGNLNVSFAYVEGESLLMGLKDIAVSRYIIQRMDLFSLMLMISVEVHAPQRR
jgi:cysteine desulfurase